MLDGEQQAAVYADERAIAVLAGPGSGKTRVLSSRARRLLAGDPGSKALLMTFTNKAAAEMKARALGVAVVTTDRIVGSTYHSFAMRLLRLHGNLVDLPDDFEILDDQERDALIGRATEEAGTRDRAKRLSYLRVRRMEPREQEVVQFAEAYDRLKRGENSLDFDDLLVLAADLLEQNDEVAQAIGNAHRHILIDEFQDTNPAQFAIVSALWSHAETVSVFADDDQGIYQFAGAEPANIRSFVAALDARTFPLTTNYRCRSNIVSKANRLISVDDEASGRQMEAHYDGGEVRSRSFADVYREAITIAGEISELIDEGTLPEEIAVLSRRRSRLTALLDRLGHHGVPVSNWLGAAFEPDERRALTTGLYVVRGELTDRQATRFCEFLDIEMSGARNPQTILEQNPTHLAAQALGELRDLVWEGAPVMDIVDKAIEALTSVDATLEPGLGTVREAVEAFQIHDPNFGIEHLLSELALGSLLGAPTTGGGVKFASIHRTKGLQWKHVYLVGLEENTLPDYNADTPGEICEERRACFVGVCRAEEHLTFTRVHQLNGYAKPSSRFLAEMGFQPGER